MLYVVARRCNSSGYLLAKFFGRRRLCIDQEQCTYQSQTARKGYRNTLNFNETQRNIFRESKIANRPLLTLGASLYTNRHGHEPRHRANRGEAVRMIASRYRINQSAAEPSYETIVGIFSPNGGST